MRKSAFLFQFLELYKSIVKKNSILLNYKIIGKGKTHVVFLHGFLFNLSIWEDIISPELKETATCLLIDLPGHGESPVYGETHSMDLMAKKVLEVLENVGWKQATFVGHSMGGYVALAFAELFPSKVKGLFLLNSNTLADSIEKKANRLKSIDLALSNKSSFIRATIPNLFLDISKTKHSKAYKKVLKMAQSTTFLGLAAAQRGMAERKDTTVVLKQFNCPIMLVFGKYDTLVELDLQLETLKDIEKQDNLRVKVMETAHMSQIENKIEVEKALIGFINELAVI